MSPPLDPDKPEVRYKPDCTFESTPCSPPPSRRSLYGKPALRCKERQRELCFYMQSELCFQFLRYPPHTTTTRRLISCTSLGRLSVETAGTHSWYPTTSTGTGSVSSSRRSMTLSTTPLKIQTSKTCRRMSTSLRSITTVRKQLHKQNPRQWLRRPVMPRPSRGMLRDTTAPGSLVDISSRWLGTRCTNDTVGVYRWGSDVSSHREQRVEKLPLEQRLNIFGQSYRTPPGPVEL
ncbi:hypothetical protein VTK73DRAFT_10237 [Phialemonium thermophilum]|uniref:Uncharacterized protein n=1 Tax=Phialemonium thermophilum TaxID=223376 RepID=A0ABR3XH38_9PEZI